MHEQWRGRIASYAMIQGCAALLCIPLGVQRRLQGNPHAKLPGAICRIQDPALVMQVEEAEPLREVEFWLDTLFSSRHHGSKYVNTTDSLA